MAEIGVISAVRPVSDEVIVLWECFVKSYGPWLTDFPGSYVMRVKCVFEVAVAAVVPPIDRQ